MKKWRVQEELQAILGDGYQVQHRYQQHAFLYQILNSEKLAVFLILTFILIIATFNIISSLSMLMIDKKNDIKTLSNLGATKRDLQQLFWLEGLLTTAIGCITGLLLGLGVCFAQLKLGLLQMGEGSFVVNHYPVAVQAKDVIIVLITVILIGALASWIPVKQMGKRVI